MKNPFKKRPKLSAGLVVEIEKFLDLASKVIDLKSSTPDTVANIQKDIDATEKLIENPSETSGTITLYMHRNLMLSRMLMNER